MGPTLAGNNGGPEQASGIAECECGEQVHALVLCLLQEGVYPAVVAPEVPQGTKVPRHCSNHAWSRWGGGGAELVEHHSTGPVQHALTWHPGNRLQEDDACEPFPFIKGAGQLAPAVARANVKEHPKTAHSIVGKLRWGRDRGHLAVACCLYQG